jgi:NtrC-family two-component system sensor histidine kinase KinB
MTPPQPVEPSVLAAITMAIGQSLDLDDTLQTALHEVLRVTHAQAGSIYLLDEAANELVTRLHHGWLRPFVAAEPLRVPLQDNLLGRVIRDNTPLLEPSFSAHPAQRPEHFDDESFEALVCAPIHARGRVTGIVSIMSGQPAAFDQASVELLCSVADTIGVALENARLYEESVAAQRRLNAVLQATADGILAIDAQERIQIVNPAAEQLLNVRATDLLQHPVSSAALPTRLRLLALSAMTHADGLRDRSLRMKLEDGRVLSAVVSPVFVDTAEGKEPGGWVLLIQDITHLAEAERARSAFLKAAAHDMRNPLSAATQSLSLVRRLVTTENPSLNEALDIAQSGLGRIQHLIDDLLTLETMQNQSEFSPELMDIGEFAFEISSEARSRAQVRGLHLRTLLAAAIPPVSGDRRILTIAVLHYIDNAVAHAPPGSEITLRFFRERGQLHIEVSDTGPGIHAEAQRRLFERFVPISLSEGSTLGFGLAIVKAAADAHSGSVYVQSSPEAGSTFGLMIPLAPVAT